MVFRKACAKPSRPALAGCGLRHCAALTVEFRIDIALTRHARHAVIQITGRSPSSGQHRGECRGFDEVWKSGFHKSCPNGRQID
jgi:hypothetical protein